VRKRDLRSLSPLFNHKEKGKSSICIPCPIRKRKGDKIALTKVRNIEGKNAQRTLKEREESIIEHIELF
jgi:hypothetical protein